MCNDNTAIDFSDLEENELWERDESGEFKNPTDLDTPEERAVREAMGGQITSRATVGRYKCTGCRGTGFINVYRRGGGWGQIPERKKCWKGCGGTGFTKTSPEARAKARERRQRRKQLMAEKKREQAQAFLDGRPDIAAWFEKHRGNPSWGFPSDLEEKLFQYGHLTPGQLGAIEKCLARDAERRERRANQPTTDLDLSSLHSGYYAVPGGDTRLKVKIDVVDSGKWAGWVFVKDGAEYGGRKRYGKQRPGQCYEGDIVDELRAIVADPTAAMAAYGHLVGRCGMCGRKLEDEDSIARGIGPVCASRL